MEREAEPKAGSSQSDNSFQSTHSPHLCRLILLLLWIIAYFLTTHFILLPPPYSEKLGRYNGNPYWRVTTFQKRERKKKKEVQVNRCFQAAFHLLWLLAGGLQLILDQALWPNLPLRLLYGSKLKWLCGALEQITSGIYGYSEPPLAGRTEEASIVWTHTADQSDQTALVCTCPPLASCLHPIYP